MAVREVERWLGPILNYTPVRGEGRAHEHAVRQRRRPVDPGDRASPAPAPTTARPMLAGARALAPPRAGAARARAGRRMRRLRRPRRHPRSAVRPARRLARSRAAPLTAGVVDASDFKDAQPVIDRLRARRSCRRSAARSHGGAELSLLATSDLATPVVRSKARLCSHLTMQALLQH